MLKFNKIYDLFDAIVTKEDVKNLKPDPEGIFKIFENLSIQSSEAIMVGDTHHDIIVAQKAKIDSLYFIPEHNKPYSPGWKEISGSIGNITSIAETINFLNLDNQ